MIEKVLTVYERVITEEFIRKVHGCAGIVEREGIFQSSIILWLMIFQRLRKATLVEAVEDLRLGASSSLLARASGSIRARTGRISGNTGGITQGRERLSIEVVKAASDALSKEIQRNIDKTDEVSNRTYIIDCQSASHSPLAVRGTYLKEFLSLIRQIISCP